MDTSAIIAIAISIATTILGAVAMDIYLHLKQKGKKAIERRKKERQEELKDALLPCIQEAVKPLGDKLDEVDEEVTAIKENDIPMLKRANRDSLRNQLFASYRHCDKVGYRTLEDTQNWEFMYNSYLELGGNSFIPTLHDQFLSLPLETLESVKYKANKKAKTKK